jgi:hypothetical protein
MEMESTAVLSSWPVSAFAPSLLPHAITGPSPQHTRYSPLIAHDALAAHHWSLARRRGLLTALHGTGIGLGINGLRSLAPPHTTPPHPIKLRSFLKNDLIIYRLSYLRICKAPFCFVQSVCPIQNQSQVLI